MPTFKLFLDNLLLLKPFYAYRTCSIAFLHVIVLRELGTGTGISIATDGICSKQQRIYKNCGHITKSYEILDHI